LGERKEEREKQNRGFGEHEEPKEN